MFQWFDAKSAEAFAVQFAKDVVRLVGKVDVGKKSRDKQLVKIHRLFGTMQKFSAAERLNIYKKAKLGQTLGRSLVDAGYPKDFAEDVVHMTLQQL